VARRLIAGSLKIQDEAYHPKPETFPAKFHTSVASGRERPVGSDKKRYNLKEKEEWILILKTIIGQD